MNDNHDNSSTVTKVQSAKNYCLHLGTYTTRIRYARLNKIQWNQTFLWKTEQAEYV